MKDKILVLGIGNLLLKDDGVGIHVIRELEKDRLPGNVEIFDGGTGGLKLIENLKRRNVIIVDAMEQNEEPGHIVRIEPKYLSDKNLDSKYSLHAIRFTDTLSMLNDLGFHPNIVIFGIQPKEIRQGMDLTPEVRSSIPHVIKMIKKEIELLTSF